MVLLMKLKGLKVYLSGPMSGLPDFNHPAFNRAEKVLEYLGALVINPARHPLGLDYSQYMSYAELDVLHADVIVMLPGWESSPGANQEFTWARNQGKQAVKYNEVSRGLQ